MKKAIIVGAGISGCALARLLAEKGYSVTVHEKKGHVGGHCYDLLSKDGIMYHRYGPHIFHTEHDEVIAFATRFARFNGYVNRVQVRLPGGKTTRLPFNFKQIRKIDPENAEAIISFLKARFPGREKVSILELRKQRGCAPLDRIADWLFDNVYAPYTAKMWGVGIADIDPGVVARVGITLSDNESYFPTAKLQGLPIGGYTKMMSRMLDHPNVALRLGSDALDFLRVSGDKAFWDGAPASHPIVYCGPIEALLGYRFGALPYRSLEFRFRTFAVARKQPMPIVNLPKDPKRTRTVEYKQMTGQRCAKTIVSTEYPGAFDRGAKKWNVPYYPINNPENDALYAKYAKKLAAVKNLHLLGRLAEYMYLDMDTSILSAIELARKL